MDLTARISQFVTETHFDLIPPQALETAKIALLDSLGVALAGAGNPAPRFVLRSFGRKQRDRKLS